LEHLGQIHINSFVFFNLLMRVSVFVFEC